MKRILLVFATAASLYACNNETKHEATTDTTAVSSTSPESKEPWVPVDSATRMKAMMDYATPGPMHQMMASWNGTWNGDMTYWESADSPAKKMTCKSVNTMILNGLHQASTLTASFEGMPFEGNGHMAYDNVKKEFISTWMDNMSSGVMTSTGTWDEAAKTLTLTGSAVDPSRPGRMCNMRQITKIIDNDTQIFEMYGPDPKTGKEIKMMEIKSTRQK